MIHGRLLALVLVLPACGAALKVDTGFKADAGTGGGDAPRGAAISAPANTWTWVDFPDATCNDGSATGVGINPGSSNNVLVFMTGGGACWDFTTCYIAKLAATGPYGRTEFTATVSSGTPGSIVDRSAAGNPFKDWSFVYVPYCTGDIHGGDHVATYTLGSDVRTWRHVGHDNVLAYLKRLGATFPSPTRFVVAGSSAGGGGAVLNYGDFRRYWPDTKMYLLDDSLPFFVGTDVKASLSTAWETQWNLGSTLEQICSNPGCLTDISGVYPALAKRYPSDRMGFLTAEQDAVMSFFYGVSGTQFEKNLGHLTTTVLSPSPPWREFYVPGNSHTLLGAPGNFTTRNVPLWTWLTQMVTDDPAWASEMPAP